MISDRLERLVEEMVDKGVQFDDAVLSSDRDSMRPRGGLSLTIDLASYRVEQSLVKRLSTPL